MPTSAVNIEVGGVEHLKFEFGGNHVKYNMKGSSSISINPYRNKADNYKKWITAIAFIDVFTDHGYGKGKFYINSSK